MKHRWVTLSWPLNERTPLYPGTPPVKIQIERSISGGDSCNTSVVTFSSHAGTHVDAPRHFFNDGRPLHDFSSDEFTFRHPLILECPQSLGGVIVSDDLDGISGNPDIDMVLIRTGFQKYRATNSEKYSTQNPCLSPEVATWLRNKFPELRAVGIDCISVASRMHRDLGRDTHYALLKQCEGDRKPLLIIEDMNLPDEYDRFDEVIICPLIVGCADGSPCIVLGRITGD
jgi:kynurenine formamidase